MKITEHGRGAIAAGTLVAALAGALASASLAKAPATPKGPTRDITVRVEGLTKTLLAPTTVTLRDTPVGKGTKGETCSGLSAQGALADATRGDWNGTWSSSYKEFLISSILGSAYGAHADYYWAFWLDDKPAAVGACDVDPAKGSSILFFPEYDGNSKSAVMPAVLGISAPASALPGKPFEVIVTSYANANGKATPAVGVEVRAGSLSATTKAKGIATLTLAHPGKVTLSVSAPHAVRDETTVCVHRAGARCS